MLDIDIRADYNIMVYANALHLHIPLYYSKEEEKNEKSNNYPDNVDARVRLSLNDRVQ